MDKKKRQERMTRGAKGTRYILLVGVSSSKMRERMHG